MAVFTGNWSDYTITESGGVYTVADNRAGSPDGTDTVTNVEVLRFADGDVSPADALNDGPSVSAADGTVNENADGAVVGAVSATDPDAGDSVTLSVDDARFEVVGGQLKLKDGETLDYETDGSSVSVTVTATDSHGAADSQVVTVTIADVNEAGVGA
ncbi:MAG: cadherin repeat domain-containing protein, partial [Pseudomonadota bacterium]